MDDKTKEILDKQLELLAEASKDALATKNFSAIAEMSHAMIDVVELIFFRHSITR